MKIPATVITGFLGSGKTTLIRHLLEYNQGRRFALIVNEFGNVGVDADLLSDCGEEPCKPGDIVELANGCLCGTVADDFLPTMTALLGLGMAAEEDLATRPSHHEVHDEHDHDDFASIVMRPPAFGNLNQANRLIRNAIEEHDLLRVKGVLRLEGKPMRLVVQAAGPRLETYFDKPWAEGKEARLVAIGAADTDWAAVERILTETAAAEV